jgi:hypothetical protein
VVTLRKNGKDEEIKRVMGRVLIGKKSASRYTVWIVELYVKIHT